MSHIVIVESPTKAKTVAKFLPKEYEIIASIGHVRDLPQNASDIPEKYKVLPWSRLGIDVENDFTPLYITIKGKGKVINEMKKKVKTADSLILATDEDREGESIAYHITQLVKPSIPVKRMVFHEITKDAILQALESFRDIDNNLVKAQETRRILDRLFGYEVSGLLWKKITYKLSSGRVQSPGLRLLVERERERYIFKKVRYSSVGVLFEHSDIKFNAKLISIEGQRIAIGSDFDNTGVLTKQNAVHLSHALAEKVVHATKGKAFTISSVEKNPQKVLPPIPFTTSTLQQEANRKLHLSARETMRVAQTIYEQGFITYMRTDSPMLSAQAIQASREYISTHFDAAYLPEKPRIFSSKSKNAQEAHEAIRPTGTQFVAPANTGLTGREAHLYKLIWERTIASQMAHAVKATTSVEFHIQNYVFTASGSTLSFPGFLALYSFSKIEEKQLPDGLAENVELIPVDVFSEEHETKPPSRYNDASLVKQLETLGVGRPSTYATIINTLLDRGYARRVEQALVPTLMGFAVTQFLEKNFHDYVDYNFTAGMEDVLDDIADGTRNGLHYLQEFYFGELGLKQRIEKGDAIDSEKSRRIEFPQLDEKYEVRVGRYGSFIQLHNGDIKENFSIPEDCNPADINADYIEELAKIKRLGPQSMGIDPKTDKNVYCLTGRYGPYVQLGEVTEEEPKPRRAQVTKEFSPSTLTLEQALKLLSIPRILGKDPKTGNDVIVTRGRFGSYIKCGDETRTLKQQDNLYTIELDRALVLLSEVPKRRKRTTSVVKDFGIYAKNKKKVGIYKGPYGLYVKYGTKNVRIPEDKKENILELSLEEVVKFCS